MGQKRYRMQRKHFWTNANFDSCNRKDGCCLNAWMILKRFNRSIKTINYVLQFWQQRGVLEMPRCRRNSCVKRVLPSSQLQEGCSSPNRWNQSPSSIISHHQSHQPITSKVSSSASSIDQHQSQFQQLQEGCSSPNRLNQSPSSFMINHWQGVPIIINHVHANHHQL